MIVCVRERQARILDQYHHVKAPWLSQPAIHGTQEINEERL